MKTLHLKQFSFTSVNKDDIQRKILDLNPKKPGTFGNIPTKMLKSSSEIYNVVLRNIWNSETLGKLHFPNKLKLADITPVYAPYCILLKNGKKNLIIKVTLAQY